MDINIYIVSDSLGETAHNLANAIMEQFPRIQYDIVKFPMIKDKEEIDEILSKIEPRSILMFTVVIKELSTYILDQAKDKGIFAFDLLGEEIEALELILDTKSQEKPGTNRLLDKSYFDTISAIEFTIKHDDGLEPSNGILNADIVLIGVSRTSKTPTSLLLATKGYRVMNVPLVPESEPPKELWEIDRRKIIGLVTSVDRLYETRKDRLKMLGMSSSSSYAKTDRIKEELLYALDVMDSLNCQLIDVTDSTIHRTASEIEKIMKSYRK